MRKLIRASVRTVYFATRHTSIVKAIEEEFEMQSYSGVTSRHYEYPFGIAELVKLSKKSKVNTVLDAGSFGSPFGLILASLGFRVSGVDISMWDVNFPGFKSEVGDLKNLKHKDGSFDAVAIISTVEHCGLARFREDVDEDGDIRAMKEMWRVIRKGGYCILTVPYGKSFRVHENKHRVYDKKSFKKRLVGKFSVLKTSYFAPFNTPNQFEPATEKQAASINPVPNGSHGVICVVLQKK